MICISGKTTKTQKGCSRFGPIIHKINPAIISAVKQPVSFTKRGVSRVRILLWSDNGRQVIEVYVLVFIMVFIYFVFDILGIIPAR